MRGNFRLSCGFSLKLNRIHVGLHYNANKKKLTANMTCLLPSPPHQKKKTKLSLLG